MIAQTRIIPRVWRRACLILMCLATAVGWQTAAAQTSDARFDVICVARRDAPDIAKRKACLGLTIFGFDSEITLAVEHPHEVDFNEQGEPDPARLVLFLEGKPLPGTRARVGKSQLNDDGTTTTLLTFRVTRDLSTETARKNWKEVIVAARARKLLTISTGLEDGAPARTQAEAEFEVVGMPRLLAWILIAVVLAVLFFWVAIRKGLLRDPEPAPAEVGPTQRAYSLARVQMAAWTVLTLLAFLYVWVLTREFDGVVNTTALALMGVSAGTLATAAGVDSQKLKANEESLNQEKGKQNHDAARITALEEQTHVCKSEGFLSDIMTSAQGPSLHRLQFVTWTAVLMLVFVVGVWESLTLPAFDDTLLALMGISSGTYIGLKLPEAKT